jgi:hypothetical protein
MAKTQPAPEPTGTEPDPQNVLDGVTVDLPDGPVTFTRPGIESMDFTVKDGKISTTKDKQDWLLRHVVGTAPTE